MSTETHTLSRRSCQRHFSKDSIRPIPQRGRTIFSIFEWLQLRGLMFINNVHYSCVHSIVLKRCVCACMCVCESPEVSCPGSCSVAPPRGPERQRQPLLKTMTNGLVTSGRPWRISQMSTRAKVEGISVMAETALGPEWLFCSWSGVTLVPRQIEMFPSVNQDTVKPKKTLSKQKQTSRVDRQPPPSLFVCKPQHHEDGYIQKSFHLRSVQIWI